MRRSRDRFDFGAAGVAVLSCEGSCSTACRPEAFRERYSAVERVLDVLGLGGERVTLVSTDSAERLASRLNAFTEDVLGLPPHVLCQGLPVPGQMHQYRTAGLLAGMSRRIGIGDALSVEHDGLPFGQPEFEASACSLCGLCADACPTAAPKYSENSESASLEFTARDCVGCWLCSDACPEGALRIARRLDGPSLAGDPIVLESAKLRRCRQCGSGHASDAMVSNVLSRLGSRAPAALAAYCPDCRMTAALRARSLGSAPGGEDWMTDSNDRRSGILVEWPAFKEGRHAGRVDPLQSWPKCLAYLPRSPIR